MSELDFLIPRTHIAYFSMEIALAPEIHTYGGGLGVLAGDTAHSCGDLELPVVLVTLLSRAGYLRQEIDSDGRQVDGPDPLDPGLWVEPLGAKIAVRIEDGGAPAGRWAMAGPAVASTTRALYDQRENVILPLYHGDRPGWGWMMKEAISKIVRYFNSHRMMRRYASEAYLR